MTRSQPNSRQSNDLLLRSIIGVAVGLTVFQVVVTFFWRPGPLLVVLSWWVPTEESFGILAALAIAFLAFGRYRVLREPLPFWIGMAFGSFAVLSVFYTLSFPGLLPGERGIIARLPNTSLWFGVIRNSILSLLLLAAVVARWPTFPPSGEEPGQRRSFLLSREGWLVLTVLTVIIIIASLSVVFEQYLPVLIVDGVYAPLFDGWVIVLLIVYGVDAVLSTVRYRQAGPSSEGLLGYTSLAEVFLAFSLVAAFVSERRYEPLWYWLYVLRISGFTAMLFGLLSEYVALFQRERENARQLAELDRLKDQFLSVAAHELKTPVTGIKGYAQFLLQREHEGVSPVGLKALMAINRQSDRISRLVNELLEISRIQTGRLELRRARIDLSRLAAEAMERLKIATEKHRFLFQSPGPVFVNADADRIEQVLDTLLENAIKFSPQGGDIEVTVSFTRGIDGEAVVSVRDYGVGIPKDKQSRIFERFYRAHAGTPFDYGGMGVGLFISQETIARHGGRMWFDSKEGEGSTFCFSLPLAQNGRQ